jgi:hypothetical protein
VVEWRVATGPVLVISQVAPVLESVQVSGARGPAAVIAHHLAAAIVPVAETVRRSGAAIDRAAAIAHQSAVVTGRAAEIVHRLVMAIDPVAIALVAATDQAEAAIDPAEVIAPEEETGLEVETVPVAEIARVVETVLETEVAPVAVVIDRLSAAAVTDLAVADRANNGDLATGRAVLAIGIVPVGIAREEITISSMVATTSTQSSTGRIGIVRTGTDRIGDGAAAVGPETGITTASVRTTAGTTAAGTAIGEVTGTLRSRGARWAGDSVR